MLTYDLQNRGQLPLYQYVYQCIRQDIATGVLSPGEKLPAKRAFAEHLGVSVMTVEGAYDQLCAEGYLEARPRQGYFVEQDHRPMELAVTPPQAVVETAPTTWQLDLHSNRIDAQPFPFATWSKLVRQVLSQEGKHLLDPVPSQGVFSLRQAIAQDLRQYRGMSVAPEQILIGAGAEYLYLLLGQLLGNQGAFGVEDPGYGKIRQVYQQAGVQVKPIALDGQGLRPEALVQAGVKIAHLSPSHQYPTGAVMPIGRRQALLRWAQEVDGYLIEDDYDSELRLSGRPIPPLQSIDTQGRVVYLNTFSQTIAPSMRVGYVVLPQKLLARYRQQLYFYASTVPALDQQVLERFLSQGYYQRHLSRMRKEYRLRRGRVLEAFETASFAHQITIQEQGAGLHFLVEVHTAYTVAQLRQRGEAVGLRLGFLSDYGVDFAPAKPTLVVNYASLDMERLPQAVALLTQVLAQGETL